MEKGSATKLCTSWDGVYRSTPFEPNKVTAPQECSDVAPTWVYRVINKSFKDEKNYLKVTVDS